MAPPPRFAGEDWQMAPFGVRIPPLPRSGGGGGPAGGRWRGRLFGRPSNFGALWGGRGSLSGVLLARGLFRRLRAVSLWPDDRHLHPVVPGSDRRPDLSPERPLHP